MQYRKLKELKKLANNPRTIEGEDFEQLCKSIKDNADYFEARPLILSDRTGELVIIGGNQRYEAAKHIGLDKAPTHLIENLTEEREKEHPTMKPVELCAKGIKNSSKKDDIVLDLFGGSGSTLIACEQLDRTCYMMELDPKYCDVIRKRYWKFIHDNNEEGWEEGTPVISERAAKDA